MLYEITVLLLFLKKKPLSELVYCLVFLLLILLSLSAYLLKVLLLNIVQLLLFKYVFLPLVHFGLLDQMLVLAVVLLIHFSLLPVVPVLVYFCLLANPLDLLPLLVVVLHVRCVLRLLY